VQARTYRSASEEETRRLGERLGARLRGGEIVLLCGDLGAGKTQFVKGIGRALDVDVDVVSPTFTMAARYAGRLPLVHYDLYRVRGAEELVELGYVDGDDPLEVSVVEWGDRAAAPPGALVVHFEVEPTGGRRIEVRGIALDAAP
jgi:tRNA threonylcarbamoyladenosine biosynthesis protein TsaE